MSLNFGDTKDGYHVGNHTLVLGLDTCYRYHSRYQQKEKTMTIYQLITEAGMAIEKWKKTHASPCRLFFSNGCVICKGIHEPHGNDNLDLKITKHQQIVGFTRKGWFRIGYALNQLQKKENLCHEPQKRLTSQSSINF